MDNPRLLVIDIETAPAELYGWQMYNANFGVTQVKAHPFIICIGYKWIGEDVTHCLEPKKFGDNKDMLKTISALLEEADAVISKNGIRFDIPWIRAELAKYKLPPLPPLTHIDLQKVAKAYFRFLSNKLDYIVQYLGIGQKVEHEGFLLWKKVMDGDQDAKLRMIEYCIGDVDITEKLYEHLKPHIENHPVLRAIGAEGCPKCNSTKTQKRGKRYTRFFEIQRHQCMNKKCRGWFSGKRTKIA